ncbi:MAG: serine protease [Cyanobacteria bacterium P01_F01_bin.150]
MSLTDQAWKDSVVRIDINGIPKGTGFFVGPALALTCHHVVRDRAQESISVYWQGKSIAIVAVAVPSHPNVDLALLSLAEPIMDQPRVILDAVLNDREPLQTFGYPENRPSGDPVTFEYEGMTGDALPLALIKFKAGQVVPGFSGSPLVKERSQKVCGVIKSTRDEDNDLGGRAVPVQVIWQIFPQLKTQHFPPNPFAPIGGRIDQAHQFFGRQKELRDIFEMLNSGSSVAVIGERQVGKSSLLKAIGRQADSQLLEPRRPVYLNLQDVIDEEDFYEALCDELGIELAKGRMLKKAVRKLEPKVLLLLDEMEKMTWDRFSEQIRSQLRGLADGWDAPLRLVVAASESLDQLFPDSKGGVSPLKGICLEENLKRWNDTQVRELIAARLVDNPISFSDEEISTIIESSEGHPQRVMLACFRLYNSLRDRLSAL